SEIGIDLNGDGETDSTVYFAIADSQVSGVYDIFFYSNGSNFSSYSSVSGNITERTFGDDAELTLLSISPDAKKVRVYGRRMGDWGELGELKIGTNVKIPVLVRAPSGDDATANVSVELIRSRLGEELPKAAAIAEITGIGEIEVNLSEVLNRSITSGKFTFALSADTGTSSEIMEEWKWPFIVMRSFLVDSNRGEGNYVTGFEELPLARYGEDTYGWIPELRTAERWNTNFTGVFASPGGDNSDECGDFQKPDGANQTAGNWTMKMDNQMDVWVYINEGNESVVWIKSGGCNFSGVPAKSVGSQVNITLNGHIYMLYVLGVNTSQWEHGAVIGVEGLNESVIMPIRIDNSEPRWRIMALNLSGQNYNILLANSTLDYPMCAVWNCFECAKVAWFDTDGDFGDASEIRIGENFTSDLYLAGMGPGPWEGVLIGNSSKTMLRPSVGVRAQGTSAWFNKIEESAIDLDLDRDNLKDGIFYMIAYDERGEGIVDRAIIDDDMNMTEEWWNDQQSENETYYDFYGNETGTQENGGGLPNAIWRGNLEFGEAQDNATDYERPSWEVEFFNNTSMLLRKHRDCWGGAPYNLSENVTFVLKAYDFSQNTISNATVSVERIMSFGMGATELEGSAYTVSISNGNRTDSKGYAVLTVSPVSSWPSYGEYMIQMRIQGETSAESKTEWLRIGPGGGGP
ncbi:MAG: hypothetical protein ACP5E4_00425, partial [Candidatus Aenigmatarchaeota archaeon]